MNIISFTSKSPFIIDDIGDNIQKKVWPELDIARMYAILQMFRKRTFYEQ